MCIAEAQKAGGVCAFIDAEHALDPEYAAKLGVDIENLIISQPDYWRTGARNHACPDQFQAIDVIVVDSVAALTPKAEIEGEMGDNHMGLHARMMSQALRKVNRFRFEGQHLSDLHQPDSRKDRCHVRQSRNDNRRTGAQILRFRPHGSTPHRPRSKTAKQSIGNRTKVKIVKNKVAPPFREAEVDIMYGVGISKEGDLLDLGVEQKLLEKSGSWYSYKGERIGQGRENARQTLIERTDLYKTIKSDLRALLGLSKGEKAAPEFELIKPGARKAS